MAKQKRKKEKEGIKWKTKRKIASSPIPHKPNPSLGLM